MSVYPVPSSPATPPRPATPRFGLEYEVNRNPDSADVADVADRYGFDVKSDCSVNICEDYETCPCCNGEGSLYITCHEGCCEYTHFCDSCGGTGDIPGGGNGAELVTNGTVDYAGLIEQYDAVWSEFGEQDDSAGVHLHTSIACTCGFEGQPHYDELTGTKLAEWHQTVHDLVGRHGDRNYVYAYGWRGVPLSYHAGGPVEYSHHGTVESRWFHSTLNVDGFRRAVAFSLSYMSCPTCGNGVGDDDIYRGVRNDATVARWSERIATSEAADHIDSPALVLSGAGAID